MNNFLVACEESQEVTEQLILMGHNAMSCDLEYPGAKGLPHYQGDVMDIINDGFDCMIAFPPCTHLAVSGAKHFEQKRKDGRQQQGIDFFMKMVNAPIKHIAIENPIGIMSSIYRKPDQIIQPYYFGDEAQKTTCLWFKNLPLLYHNKKPNLFDQKITHVGKGNFYFSPSGKKMPSWCCNTEVNGKKIGYNTDEIKKIRSKTFPGIAKAMGQQWGDYLNGFAKAKCGGAFKILNSA